tara:strand:+ start:3045 stop:3371 length:327 start_codon:yes stop_codon:yes gene_type:complete
MGNSIDIETHKAAECVLWWAATKARDKGMSLFVAQNGEVTERADCFSSGYPDTFCPFDKQEIRTDSYLSAWNATHTSFVPGDKEFTKKTISHGEDKVVFYLENTHGSS